MRHPKDMVAVKRDEDRLTPVIVLGPAAAPDRALVLVVNGDERVRAFVRLLVQAEGFSGGAGRGALTARSRTGWDGPALVLLDPARLGVDTKALVRGMRAAYGRDLVVLIFVPEHGWTLERARRFGAYRYLATPVAVDTLVETVQRLVLRRAPPG